MSVPEWQRNAQLFAALEQTATTIGRFVRDENGLAIVQVGNGELPVRYGTRYKPRPGDGVVLTFHGNTVRLTGPTASRSKLGTVLAVKNPFLSVQCDGRTYTQLAYTQAYANQSNEDGKPLGPLVGDRVAIDWEGYYVIDQITENPPEPDVPPLTTDQQDFTLTFFPTQSGSYTTAKNKWNGTKGDLYCDSTRQAAWFYGDKVRNSLKDGAFISSAEIYLSLRTKSGEQPTIGRHYDLSQQKDGVSLNDGKKRGWKGWVPLPLEWVNAWRTDVGGVSISGGKSVYRGISTDHQSGKLRIRGRQ